MESIAKPFNQQSHWRAVNMRILLLAMPDTGDWLDHVMRLPNLALTSLAASVDGYDVRVLDLVLVKENLKQALDRYLDSFQPDLVGMSAMTFQYDTMIRIATYIRRKLPDVKLAAGGYHTTLMYHEIAAETPDVPLDFMIRGEGEATFRELVETLSRSTEDFGSINGLSWRNNRGAWIHNPERALLNLERLPLPNRSARLEKNFHVFGRCVDVAETSRGCPLRCNFCSIRKMYGPTFRPFPIERIIADLKSLKFAGVKFVFFSDDNITYDPDHFKSICKAIINNGLNSMEYSIQASAYGIAKNPDLVALMAQANVRLIVLGVESMDPSVIKFMKKTTSIEINREAVRLLKKHHMGISALFIIGFPDDTKQSIQNSFRDLMDLKPDALYCQFITPYPKTEVRELLMSEGLVVNPNDFSTYDGYHCNIRTRHLSREELWKIFTRENIKSWWPQLKGGNYLLKHYFWGYMTCELKVAATFIYRLVKGRAHDWRMEL
jgi:anaerobic magnesium-protoporphyrin IX monomethyl ester cyclase